MTFTPTVPHCSMSTLIGLCLRVKLLRALPARFKLDIKVGAARGRGCGRAAVCAAGACSQPHPSGAAPLLCFAPAPCSLVGSGAALRPAPAHPPTPAAAPAPHRTHPAPARSPGHARLPRQRARGEQAAGGQGARGGRAGEPQPAGHVEQVGAGAGWAQGKVWGRFGGGGRACADKEDCMHEGRPTGAQWFVLTRPSATPHGAGAWPPRKWMCLFEGGAARRCVHVCISYSSGAGAPELPTVAVAPPAAAAAAVRNDGAEWASSCEADCCARCPDRKCTEREGEGRNCGEELDWNEAAQAVHHCCCPARALRAASFASCRSTCRRSARPKLSPPRPAPAPVLAFSATPTAVGFPPCSAMSTCACRGGGGSQQSGVKGLAAGVGWAGAAHAARHRTPGEGAGQRGHGAHLHQLEPRHGDQRLQL